MSVLSGEAHSPLFTEAFKDDIWSSGYKSVNELIEKFDCLNLVVWPPNPWFAEQFFINPASVQAKGSYSDDDFNYLEIWMSQGKAAFSKFQSLDDYNRQELLRLIENAISKCTVAINTLNLALLKQVDESLVVLKTENDVSVDAIIKALVDPEDRMRLLSPFLVKNNGWIDLFVWKIPSIAPEMRRKSIAIGRCFWTLRNLENFTKYEIEGKIWRIDTRMLSLASIINLNND